MYVPAWTLWLQDDAVPLAALKKDLAPLHQAGVSLEFYRRPGVTLVRATGDAWKGSRAAASRLARSLRCPVFHLWGSFGTIDSVSAEAFDATGASSWSAEAPEEPKGTWSFERAYWRVHRALKLPGKESVVFLFSDAPFGVAQGWRKLGDWIDEAQAGAQRKAAGAIEECVEALAAKVHDDVAVVLIDVKAAQLRAATHASIAARERKLKPKSLLLQRCPEASLKIWSQVESFPFAVPLTPERFANRELIKAVERALGKGVHVVKVHNTNRRERDFEAFWLTRAPSPPGKKLKELSPKDLLQVLAENGTPRPVVDLTRKELEDLDRLMAKDALTFAPLLAPRLAEKGGGAYLRMLHVLNEPATRKLAKNAAYVKALRKVYQRQPISRVADALKRVGVEVSD